MSLLNWTASATEPGLKLLSQHAKKIPGFAVAKNLWGEEEGKGKGKRR